jgi:hypothetical protein
MKPLLASLLLLLCLPASAEIYKWTDANGRVHFGDKPTGTAAKSATVALPPPPDNAASRPAASSTPDDRRERQRRLLEVMAQERAEKERKAQALAAEEAELNRKCSELRNFLKDSEGRPLYTTDDDGVNHFLTEEQRLEYMAKLRSTLQEKCQ